MKKILINLYLIIISILFINCQEKKYNHSNKENNLYFVFSSFRHGARKPFVNVDIFKNKIKNPGKLTQFGAKQHLNIGKNNRERYFNFLNLGNKTFNTEQILVRSSTIQRTLLSTKMQLQGLLNSQNYYNIIHAIKLVNSLFILYNLNITNNTDIFSYYNKCNNKRKLTDGKYNPNFNNVYNKTILPLFEKCYGKIQIKSIYTFCDQYFSSYYEYKYESSKSNKINNCAPNIINQINDFCVSYHNSIRGWNEKNAYYFYSFFSILLKYMKDAIDGIGQLKMIMIGGHDSSVDILMNFLSGMNIVQRTEYPHYAFNILFELRKYNNQYYIEIYYNDNLKYNKTMDEFKNVLDKSKYSDMNNYCKTFHSVKINIKPENKTKKFRIKIINYIIIIVLVLIVIGIIIFLVIRRKKKKLDTSKSIANISTNTNISTTDIIKK